MHVAFGGAFVVCFIIGICTLLLGCNPNLDNQCIAYDVVEGTVYGYRFTTDICSHCVSYNKKNDCTAYTYYPCYDAYVKYNYGSNHTCTYQTKSDSTSQSAAHNSVDSYDIGDKKKLLKMKGGSTCSDMTTGMVTWGVGVAFLSLCGFILIMWIGIALFLFCQVTMRSQNLAAFDKQREQNSRRGLEDIM